MPRGAKDDERIRMMIRDLLKEPENRRCINCNTLGPQYVCTTFWTFVCTNCSAVHREFSHRVKSVMMGKFSEDEITALQSGGNERAKQMYFKNWNPQQDSYPDSSSLQKLREFVNLVYIDKKYTGDCGSIKLPRVKSESRGNFSEWPCEKPNWGRRDDHISSERVRNRDKDRDDEYNIFERTSSSGGRRLSLRDFLEERNPRNTEEMPRSRSQTHRSSRVEIIEDRFRESINSVKESGAMTSPPTPLRNTTSLPVLRSINDIFEDGAPELRIGDGRAGSDGDGKEDETKKKANEVTNSVDLIDFSDDRATADQAGQMPLEKANVKSNQIEALLIELSPPSTPASSTPMMQPAPAQLDCTRSDDVETTLPLTVIPVKQDAETHRSPFDAGFGTSLQTASSVASLMNEHGNRSSFGSDDLRRTKSVPVVQSFQVRNEIPEGLFTSSYHHPSFVGGWPTNLPHGAAYNMQFHHPPMPLAGYPVPSKSKNPFDIDDDRSQVQAATFPYTAPFQGDIPNMAASVVSPYASAQNMYSYGMNMHLVPGAYMADLSNNMLLTRPEENANIVRSEDAFASLNPIYRGSGPHSLPAPPPSSSLSRSGNPFE